MTTHETEEPIYNDAGERVYKDEGPPGPFQEASFVDLIKQDLNELAEATDVLIPIKGYEHSGLQVKYTLPENGKELDNITRRVERTHKTKYDRQLYMIVDTMIHLCQGIYVQPPGDESITDPVELDPEMIGEPVRFDERLAKTIGMPVNGDQHSPGARAVVFYLFRNNDLAIMDHGERLNRWLMNTKADLNAELWQLGG